MGISLTILRMRRKTFAFVLAICTILPTMCPAVAESGTIAVIKSDDLKPYSELLRGLKDSCGCTAREISLQGDDLQRILSSSPDAVVAIGTKAFKKIKSLKNLPVIYTMSLPSEAAAAIGPNISGVSMDISPSIYFSTMSELFPTAKRIGLLYDPQNTGAFVQDAIKAAAAARIELKTVEVDDPSEVPAALEQLDGKIDLLWMLPDPTVVKTEAVEYLIRYSIHAGVPVFTFSRKYVEMGAVAALDVDPYDMGVQAGEIVRKLSAGEPGPLRVYARKTQLTINRPLADKMNVMVKVETQKKAEP